MTEEAKLIIETLRYCEESGARCGGCPSGVLRCLGPSKIADLIESLSEQLGQVTRERDAAVEDLQNVCRVVSVCFYCKSRDAEYVSNDCMDCVNSCNWQWRGVEVDT